MCGNNRFITRCDRGCCSDTGCRCHQYGGGCRARSEGLHEECCAGLVLSNHLFLDILVTGIHQLLLVIQFGVEDTKLFSEM